MSILSKAIEMDTLVQLVALIIDWVVFIIGPCLISLATGLIGFVCYTGFGILLPMKAQFGELMWFVYVGIALFLLFNVVFNYYSCVTTNPGTDDSPAYERLLSEAKASGKVDGGPDTLVDGAEEKQLLTNRVKAKPKKGEWTENDPLEWGFCRNAKKPKPPRAHYCHVSKRLVLNMDHYCPWMFNCVGYCNYRYFFLFLTYMWLGCAFVCMCSAEPFLNRRMRFPGGRAARSNVTFMFVLTLSVGIAVTVLLVWHIYLVLSAQTTIEFYGNLSRRRRARRRGDLYSNPYDMGWRRNWNQVFGPMHPLIAVLPSRRAPPFPPWPRVSKAMAMLSSDRMV